MIEEKYFQPYYVVLTNGKEIETWEDYDLPFEDGLIETFKNTTDNETIKVSIDVFGNCAYIPKKNILYIYEGFVRKASFDECEKPENDDPCA